ncbi:MAG: hypothetical protein ACLQVI_24885 [Polyangiaceae bacterium]
MNFRSTKRDPRPSNYGMTPDDPKWAIFHTHPSGDYISNGTGNSGGGGCQRGQLCTGDPENMSGQNDANAVDMYGAMASGGIPAGVNPGFMGWIRVVANDHTYARALQGVWMRTQ